LDAIDYFMDDERKNSQQEEHLRSGKEMMKEKRKGPFIINVPDPLFAASGDSQSVVGHPLSPLNPQEHEAINNLKDYSKDGAKKQIFEVILVK